jgi:hypothetical protein
MSLRCAECDELAARWRAAGELDEDEEEGLLVFCPRRADREFGPFGWSPR